MKRAFISLVFLFGCQSALAVSPTQDWPGPESSRTDLEKACEKMLKLSARTPSLETASQNLAAQFLWMLTLDHRSLQTAMNARSPAKDADRWTMFHMSAGFMIRPPEELKSTHRYQQNVRAKGLLNTPWSPAKTDQSFDVLQKRLEIYSDIPSYSAVPLENRQKLATAWVESILENWNALALPARLASETQNFTARMAGTQKIEIRLQKSWAAGGLVSHLHELAFHLAPGPTAVNVSLLDIEIADRAKILVRDFLVDFFPSILNFRKSLIRSAAEGVSISKLMNEFSEPRRALYLQIMNLQAGRALVKPNYDPPAPRKDSGARLVLAQDMDETEKPFTLPSPPPVSDPIVIESQSLVDDLRSGKTESLKLARQTANFMDELIGQVKRRDSLSPLRQQLKTPADLIKNLSAILPYFSAITETEAADVEKIDFALRQARPLVAALNERLAGYTAELESGKASAMIVNARLSEAELLSISVTEALLLLEQRARTQGSWVERMNYSLALLRRIRTQQGLDLNTTEITQKLFDVIHQQQL